ncbi:hypothetical protein FGSG_05816 [Fusarium graminearum PH-1]|uniref:Chromosome 3, complete genome n=1 Tax=Gibberella zeae (strain ATCC MYA-4620 / CBS 123657 / FGSC 9075 / NRRL 31084 / PH-1) TaxID=229533 RepID=I1RP63_GIBZE|nr:hypothetical protein FGSG_05816 [Fusarium graminearum PH-1]ESU11833.1 hypothetical protein FGSG_05816 [Fusarium graminearum PH-1]CAF3582351.1 unnamed protein product [Fusarium graminearum]CEF86279.1 unnamed protein product [Fusarium graminearum]|eukprot:XP_011324409.1 hypothetical protein FGSG_05816 [Fusarium graminearum PH-1]
MVKEYFLAPNYTTAAEGPIKLGSILRNITEFEPLNQVVETIPATQLYPVDVKEQFEISLHELHSVNLNLKARALGLLGLGTGASIERVKGSNDVISCHRLETLSFNPTDSYIEASMEDSNVKRFMRSSRFRKPIYMVTGLKIARAAFRTSSTNSLVAVEHNTSLLPPGAPVAVGGTVKKIWLDRKNKVKQGGYRKMAVMQGETSVGESPFAVRSDDDLTPGEVEEMFSQAED